MRYSMIAMLMCGTALGSQAQFKNNLMPQPAELHPGNGALMIAAPLTVETPGSHDARLDRAIERASRRFDMITGFPYAAADPAKATRLVVHVQHPGNAVQAPAEDESYSLKVGSSGAEIDAPNDFGAIHGLETLLQLLQPAESGYVLPEVEIRDAPRFGWRGLLVDCGRHFESVEEIKRTLDGMAAVKLNVLHWHITEDQGFRIESKVFPKLTANASDGLFYTQEQAREVVAYARDRGIRVVPEFEMPGHSTAMLVAYPELSSGKAPEGVRREFGISPYALDPAREETYTFIEKFLREMSTIFPDEYIHIGGDETPAPDWKTDPRILAFKKKHGLADNAALQAYFNTRVLAILVKLHKRMVGWDEVLDPALPKDVVVQSWRGIESLGRAAKMGHDAILSQPYYLDRMAPAGEYYLADPAPATADLTPEQRRHILGAEVCMWGEHLDERTIDSRIWPRTAAMAERFWSPEQVRDVDDMYRRLEPVSVELEALGLRHLQSEDAGLRELARTENIAALRVFASALEPVSFHERYQQQHTSALTPLDRFVDAVRPDPPSRHRIELLTKRFLANPTGDAADRAELEAWFAAVGNSVPTVQQQMKTAPRLRDVAVRAGQLADLSRTAGEAINLLASGKKAPGRWKTAAARQVEQARQPSAIVRFTFLDALHQLVSAVPE